LSITKTDYQQYLNSSDWRERRKDFLEANNFCTRCQMPRWLAEIAYDQDLNVHHKSYENLGSEDWDDLESLCRRCHEIHKFGRSDLREPKSATCQVCQKRHWNPYNPWCSNCELISNSFKFCSLCGQMRFIDCRENKDNDLCEFCCELNKSMPAAIWNLCGQPVNGSIFTMDEVIMTTLIANKGVDYLLNSLVKMEPFAAEYLAARENFAKEEEEEKKKFLEDIPF
jgi:hypothetical protein